MKFPVVIAAYNEEASIGRTLKKLDASRFEPIVVANGCTDNTVSVAKAFGIEVIDRYEQGKLPAIQQALRALGARALGNVFYTDADSYPLSNKHWVSGMLKHVSNDTAQIVSGPIAHIDGDNAFDDVLRSVKRQVDIRQAKRTGLTRCFGANMVTRFHDADVLDQVLEMPHIWPGEDRAIEEVIVESGGEKTQVTDARASVLTSSRYLPTVAHVLHVGREQARKEVLHYYDERAAIGSIAYGKYARRRRKRSRTN